VEGDFATASDGTRLWYRVDGSGVPLVLCHGGPGLWDNLGALAVPLSAAATAQVVRWEQRGCGRSEPCGPYTTEQCIADLEDLRAALGYEQWIVGGHSWGATLALHYALAHPDRCFGLLYVAGVGLGRAWNAAYHEEADRRLSDVQRRRRDDLSRLDRTAAEERDYRALSWAPDFADRSAAAALASTEASAAWTTNYECNRLLNAETKTWDEQTLVERCRHLSLSALVVHGECDPRPLSATDSLVAALPSAERYVVQDAGHRPWVEAPDAVVSRIAEFVEFVDRRCRAC
jgi:proline iminopeptidase